jgi:hypothetical protein
MSAALFHDTVTLYLYDGNGGYARRVIQNVKVVFTKADFQAQTVAKVYLPLWGRRSLRYCPDAWDGRADRFTVRPRDVLICREVECETPPSDALTVRSVIHRKSGSHRLWHLEIKADHYDTYPSEEVLTNERMEA